LPGGSGGPLRGCGEAPPSPPGKGRAKKTTRLRTSFGEMARSKKIQLRIFTDDREGG